MHNNQLAPHHRTTSITAGSEPSSSNDIIGISPSPVPQVSSRPSLLLLPPSRVTTRLLKVAPTARRCKETTCPPPSDSFSNDSESETTTLRIVPPPPAVLTLPAPNLSPVHRYKEKAHRRPLSPSSSSSSDDVAKIPVAVVNSQPHKPPHRNYAPEPPNAAILVLSAKHTHYSKQSVPYLSHHWSLYFHTTIDAAPQNNLHRWIHPAPSYWWSCFPSHSSLASLLS